MQLKKHPKNITNPESWYKNCPPKKGKLQWCDGRSAKELAKYMTHQFPTVPKEIEDAIKPLVSMDSQFDWDAEHVTALPGKGEGRNHDAILFNNDIIVTIEAKADEPLGNLIKEEMQNASINKLGRITALLSLVFKDGFTKYQNLRYQLLTASAGTILEAQNQNVNKAVLLVLVFKTNGRVTEEKLTVNHEDIKAFLNATNASEENGLMIIPNKTKVKLYFKEIVI